jgi:uncharacterized protein YbcI
MADSDTTSVPGLPAELSGSLASVWKQYTGERPADPETQIRGNRVRCVLKDVVGLLDHSLAAAAKESDVGRQLTESSFRRDSIAAVRRVSRRRVVAFISDHDTETDVATEVFLLEASPYRRVKSHLPPAARPADEAEE